VNCTGVWQSFKGVAKGLGASRPAWKVLRVLANFLHLEGFDYESSEAIREELHAHLQTPTTLTATFPSIATEEASIALTRIGEIPLYAIDSLVRHAPPLQATQTMMEGDLNVAKLHPETAKRLGIQAGDIVSVTQSARITLPVLLDERIAQEAVWIAGGLSATSLLGDLIGEITLNRE
jgi:NADH-quinone oxidoreductase subunit G